MITNIQKQLEIIEKSNTWIKKSAKGNKAKKAYHEMVDFRRKLTRKRDAHKGNPAAAMYGESQAGKSYLVSALLSVKSKPFNIFDGNGKEFNFKNKINPRGNEMESTSVVTRFSTKHKWINKDYPIIAELLSPTDIILIICEAYYNNVKVNKPLSFNKLEEKIKSFESNYENKEVCQKLIIEDHIRDIEEYFNDNFSTLIYTNIKDANFFEKMFELVTKIPIDEWKDVFSLLWNFNPRLTKLFDDLINQYKKLNFTDKVYLPIDAVLRDKGTLLDVSRLDEIYGEWKGEEPNYSEQTSVLYKDKTGNEIKKEFSKPFLCALTAEIIFILPEELENDKPFLAQTDLLDFPGNRRFERTSEDNISDQSLTILLRRGRVDYLFNKYSKNERINALLFCQNHKMSSQSVMPEKLNRWIENMIGKTPHERETYKSPISPLFIISTWFNKDLEFDFNNDKPGETQSLNERWQQRFVRTLSGEIIKSSDYSWFNKWTSSKPNFQNIYLLRDFDESSEFNSQIYKGFNEFKEEKEEIIPDNFPNFRQELRKSFLDYDFVKSHFENPAKSWDEAASINKDGTELIIDKLTIAANNINAARKDKTLTELSEVKQHILAVLDTFFEDDDKDRDLEIAKNMAGDIQFKLATAFSADKIKNFGKLMKELMLDESSVLKLFREKMDDLEHRDVVIMDIYSTYRMEVPVKKDDTAEEYFERLCIRYEKTTEERKREFRKELEDKQIDLEVLIQGNADLIKNNSQQLAEALLEYWFEYIPLNDKQTIQQILVNEDSDTLQEISNMYRKLFRKLEIAKQIAMKIRRYVDNHNKTDLPFEIIADISTELLNKCINTVGFEYLDEPEINGLRQANKKNNLGLILDNNTNSTENSLEELFTNIKNQQEMMTESPEKMKSLSNYRNYFAWSNRLKIGFVSVTGAQYATYDKVANDKLGKIIDECKTINYE